MIWKNAPDDPNSVVVEGKITGPDLDLDGQVIDRDFARKAVRTWFDDWGNIRQMHSAALPPAGKAFELDQRDDGDYIKAKIIEPTSVKLVREGVYQAFSIGIAKPRIVRDARRAPNGVVVGGTVVENSLVDYPSNPTTKFMIAKRASDVADIEYIGKTVDVTKAVTADLVKCACGCSCAPGEPDPDCTCDCQECQDARSGTTPTVTKRDMAPNVGGGVDRDKLPDEDFAGPDRSFPIVTPGDVSDAASSLGRAKGDRDAIKAKIISIAHRKGQAFVDELPDAWKPDSKKAATPYELKRLHDIMCPSHSWSEMEDEYPSITKNGVAAALGSPTMGMLYHLLQQEVAEDAGTGTESDDIHHLASAYDALCDFLADEAMEAPDVAASARADLHKAYQDGMLTKDGRTYYTLAGRDKAKAIMQQLHDHIAEVFPDLCPLSGQTADETPPIENVGDDAQKTAASEKESVVTTTTESTTPVAVVTVDASAGLSPADLTKAIADAITAAIQPVSDKVDAIEAKLTDTETKIATVTSDLEKIASEPDPAKAPMRGMQGLTVTKGAVAADKVSFASEASRREREFEIASLKQLANSTSPYRFAAAEKLAAMQQQ